MSESTFSLVSETGEWSVKIGGITYDFYYSEIKEIKGLLLSGCLTPEKEYEIRDYAFSATKEDCPHFKSGYCYLLHVRKI